MQLWSADPWRAVWNNVWVGFMGHRTGFSTESLHCSTINSILLNVSGFNVMADLSLYMRHINCVLFLQLRLSQVTQARKSASVWHATQLSTSSLFSQTKEPTWMPLFKTKLRWIQCLSCCAPAGLLTRPYLLTTFITACHDPAHQVNRQNTGSQMSHLSRRVTESIFSAHRFIIAPIITAMVCVGGNAILVGKSVLHQVLCLHWSGGQLGKAAAAPILPIFMSVKDNYGEW